MPGLLERPRPADVIVVLGSYVRRDGTPSPRLKARLDRGIADWRAGYAPVIVVSSGVFDGLDEAAAMRRYVLEQGVPDSCVVADPHGRNTWETARFVRAWLDAHHGRSALAVSQRFHLLRCRIALRRFGVPLVSTDGPDYYEWRDLLAMPREVAGLVKYVFRPAPRRSIPGGTP